MKTIRVGKVEEYSDDLLLNQRLDEIEIEESVVIEEIFVEGGIIYADTHDVIQYTITQFNDDDNKTYHGSELGTFFKGNEPKSGPLNTRYTDIQPEVWQKEIKEVWKHLLLKGEDDPSDERFIEAIWNASKNILPGLEISVIIDRDGRLFMNSGSPGYVDYGGVMVAGMKIPIKCWIHNHPFGSSFWSGTDTHTLRNWRPILDQAIVIGNKEYLKWDKLEDKEVMTKVVWTDQFKL